MAEAQELTRGLASQFPREMVGAWNSLVKAINSKKGVANDDAPSFDFSIGSPDASDLATVITLANEIKTDLNLLIIYVNLFATLVNNLQDSLRSATLLSEE